ncbi:MAG: hypothetical protein JO146_08295 [Candidatus Eremiobacteraeota bacterium]|nr:hypothetical protein [Candidatus Eremiobacteraeota bacterium]
MKRIALLLACVAAGGCSTSAPQPKTPAPKATAAAALEWKPGSHSAAVFERLQEFRLKQRERFKDFFVAYEASRGNVKYPRLARLKRYLIHTLLMDENDYEHLPGYMKVFTGTGPYRRLISNPGYSYVAGTVFLPCKATRLHATFETAFAYVGGWGTGSAGKAVDAGFQRSDKLDDYAPFILAQDFHQISKYPRMACGHPVDFRFYAASDRELRLWTKGVTTNGRVEVVEARLKHPVKYGWPSNGGGTKDGIVLKRMTTIGQADADEALPKGVAWDEDGSYFGHYAGERQPLVRWSKLMLGRVDNEGKPIDLVPWNIDQTNLTFRAGMINYPLDSRNIWYTCTACSDESNAINLAGGKP